MGHEHHRDAPLAVELLEGLHDLAAGAGVEVAGRLVGQQQLRLADQRPGDGDPLLLTAGELRGLVPHAVAEPDGVERGRGPFAALALRERRGRAAAAPRCRSPVVRDEQLEGLEDEPDRLVAQHGQLGVGQRGRIAVRRR